MRKDRIHQKILSTEEYSQQSGNVGKRDSFDRRKKSERGILKTLLFI